CSPKNISLYETNLPSIHKPPFTTQKQTKNEQFKASRLSDYNCERPGHEPAITVKKAIQTIKRIPSSSHPPSPFPVKIHQFSYKLDTQYLTICADVEFTLPLVQNPDLKPYTLGE
ncbi:AAEL006873-PA, partial [Aedes aegypti]